MKALGISFGRKMQNSEIMVKQVLKQMAARGFETQFIRAHDLDIKPCTGCNACVGSLLSGKNGACVLKDDFHILDEAILEADAIVVCAPVYVFAPCGLFKDVCDRMGPSHDIAFRTNARELGEKLGVPADKRVDERSFKTRVAGILSVGGARTKHWTSLGLPQLYEFTMSSGMNVVDAYNAYAGMDYQHLVGNEELMARMTKMGDNLADALTVEGAMDKWYGDEQGVCPVCHNDLLTILHDENKVECPICGITGELTLKDGKIDVDFSKADLYMARPNYGGKVDHFIEIRDSVMSQKKIENLSELLAPYKD